MNSLGFISSNPPTMHYSLVQLLTSDVISLLGSLVCLQSIKTQLMSCPSFSFLSARCQDAVSTLWRELALRFAVGRSHTSSQGAPEGVSR